MYKHPEPQFICDISGKKYPRSQMRMMWNGLYVHKSQWEPRQPQDFTTPVRPSKPLLNARPDTDPVFRSYLANNLLLDENGNPLVIEGGEQYIVSE